MQLTLSRVTASTSHSSLTRSLTQHSKQASYITYAKAIEPEGHVWLDDFLGGR